MDCQNPLENAFDNHITLDRVFGCNIPINTKRIVENAYTTISFWMIKSDALILEHCGFRENCEDRSTDFRDKEYDSGLLYGYMLCRLDSLANLE